MCKKELLGREVKWEMISWILQKFILPLISLLVLNIVCFRFNLAILFPSEKKYSCYSFLLS